MFTGRVNSTLVENTSLAPWETEHEKRPCRWHCNDGYRPNNNNTKCDLLPPPLPPEFPDDLCVLERDPCPNGEMNVTL